jgi:hypothetical protein
MSRTDRGYRVRAPKAPEIAAAARRALPAPPGGDRNPAGLKAARKKTGREFQVAAGARPGKLTAG